MHSVFIKNSFYSPGFFFEKKIYEDIEAENFYLFDKDCPINQEQLIRVCPMSKTKIVGVKEKFRRSGSMQTSVDLKDGGLGVVLA